MGEVLQLARADEFPWPAEGATSSRSVIIVTLRLASPLLLDTRRRKLLGVLGDVGIVRDAGDHLIREPVGGAEDW